MHPILEKVYTVPSNSFTLKEEILPYIKIGWHFHPEYELTLFTESTGKLFIGDHTDNFGPGDLYLIGPDLPHYMRNHEIYYKGKPDLRIRAIVIHFAKDFLGEKLFNIPEMVSIKKLLQNSARGIHINGVTQQKVAPMMESLLYLDSYRRLITLLDILQIISQSNEIRFLSSMGYQNSFSPHDAERINAVFDHLMQHFEQEINLSQVASRINMSESAFCKFFKSRTGKTFSHILNEIRIGHACKMFIEQGSSVSDICYSCGYNSLSYFNRKFKSITKYSPLDYRKQFYHEPKG